MADAGGHDVDSLAQLVSQQLEEVIEALELLQQLREHLPEPLHEELSRKLYRLDTVSRDWRNLVPDPEAPVVLGFRHQGGVRRVGSASFASEVLESAAPVLLSLQVEGHPSCQAADDLLVTIRESYSGELKLCSLGVMEAELEEIPQMLKLGREFIFKSLPALLLYWRGRMAGSSTGQVDIERWVQVISAEVNRRAADDSR